MTDIDLIIKNIRKDLRLSMDGVVSSSMREKGIAYKMNFGVNVLKLREISLKYKPDRTLAELLWKQDVRELKILATLLYPIADCSSEVADKWASEIPNQEIREQICMNLFRHLTDSGKLINKWILADDDQLRITGYWLFARLAISQVKEVKDVDLYALIDKAVSDICSQSVFLCGAAMNALKFAGRHSPEIADEILKRIDHCKNSSDLKQKGIFDMLYFEFRSC